MPHTIVHVDDDPTILKLVALTFEKAGHRVVSITDSETAAAEIRRLNPALLICDISMPSVNGFELVASLRQGPEPFHSPVIFFSAVGGDDVVLKAFALGAVDFVRKPASLVELQARVEARLANGTPRPAPDLRGSLALLSVADLLTAAEAASKTARLLIHSDGRTGEITLKSGNIVSGTFGGESGDRAVYRIVGLTVGDFEMSLLEPATVSGPLEMPPRFALMEAARLKDEGVI